MTRGEEVFTILQSKARSTASRTGGPAPTQEYLVRHLLESFLDRLVRSGHGDDFVLKGGILLAAYGVRRPTKDADANAINAGVTPEHLTLVVTEFAEVPSDDCVTFEIDSISVQEIREHADYPGFRVRVNASMLPASSIPFPPPHPVINRARPRSHVFPHGVLCKPLTSPPDRKYIPADERILAGRTVTAPWASGTHVPRFRKQVHRVLLTRAPSK